MFDFSPTPEQQAVVEKVRRLMDELVYPNEKYVVPHHGLPPEVIKPLQRRVREAGLWAPHMPRAAGGLGMGYVTLGLINEILGRSAIAPRIFNTNAPDTGNAELLWVAGTEEQKARFLKPLMEAEVRSCFAMTEPELSGSDPTALGTTAVLDGDEWVINGHKWFATGAHGAAFAIVMAVTDPDAPPHARASMILVDAGTPGFNLVRDVPVMGDLSEGGHGEFMITNCRVPRENLLGKRGEGFKLAQLRLGPGRITHCMRWLGQAGRAFDLMVARALQRETRGKRLAEFGSIQNFVADSVVEMEAARLMTLKAAWKMDQGDEAREEIALIKFFGAKVMIDVIDRAIQVYGGMGISADTPLEAMWREARAARIYDGPDEVHKYVVARRVFKSYGAALRARAQAD
ncbi:MAG TPA: acyl-CoA dehydrogenase family protein [Symbiobacteriaceae bacterium]|jgi:alkylation response protein AidB-like acyl-CoA dehydrogenase